MKQPVTRSTRNRWPIFALSAILLGAFALRVHLLGAQNVWWDEALAIWARRKGFWPMTLWTAADVHPPLFFWGLFATTAVAGQTEFAARFPDVVYGLLTIPFAYQLGRRLTNRTVGLLTALLIATARFHVWWSQEMRMYALAGLMGTASLYFFVTWWQKERHAPVNAWRSLVPYVLASVSALYSLYLSAFVLLVENAFVFIAGLSLTPPDRRRTWWRWALGQMVTFLCFLPWLLLALDRMNTWSSATPFDFSLFVQLYVVALSLGISTHIERYLPIALPFLAIGLAGLALAWTQAKNAAQRAVQRETATLLLLCLTVPPLAVYLLSRPRGLFYSPHVEARYLLPFAGPFYLFVAWGLVQLWRRWRAVGALCGALVLAAFAWSLPQHYADRYLRDELQTMVRTISAYTEANDVVAVVSGNRYPIWDYYYNDPLRPGPRPPVLYLPSGADELTAENVTRQLSPLLAAYDRIWLAHIDPALQDPQSLAPAWLSDHWSQQYELTADHNTLYLYAPPEKAPSLAADAVPQHRLALDLSPAGTLLGYDLPTTTYRPGDQARLALYWQDTRPARVMVQWRDAQGAVRGQGEATLSQGGGARQIFTLDIYPRTPAGRYTAHIQVDDVWYDKPLAWITVSDTKPLLDHAAPETIATWQVDDLATLEGYTLTIPGQRGLVEALQPGDQVELTLFWRARQKIDHRYTVFTQLVGQAYNPATNGPLWAQHDTEPLDGGWPTTQWLPGELMADKHAWQIPENAPAGDYQLWAGLYDLQTGQRLPITNESNQVSDHAQLATLPLRVSP